MQPHRLIFGRDEAVAAWVARQMPVFVRFGECRAVAIASAEGRPLGGVVYSDYSQHAGTVQLSIATVSPLWAQRGVIRAILSVPFEQYLCQKAWAITAVDNSRAIRLLEHIGFRPEATLRHQLGRGKHARFFGMTSGEYAAKWKMKEAA